MKICHWDNFDEKLNLLRTGLTDGQKLASPFVTLGLFDSPELQKVAASLTVSSTLKFDHQISPTIKHSRHKKIRIGYFSMDFFDHPVSHLMIDLFELHDRDKFEIYAFSFGAIYQDPMRHRLEKCFDRFLDVFKLDEFEIISIARELEIDIAIDLGGHTKDSRPQIFSGRAAPIQVNYLGYPGTWGAECMDYFIADTVTISNENLDHFYEKIVYMPFQFQVNPATRPIARQPKTREYYGLPKDTFVFCCFNNNWKIHPLTFSLWIKLLRNVPNSVLWLYAENADSRKNLARYASEHGVDVGRLIFAERVCRNAYIERFAYADLFLDTLPYNAGTTASDALWAGLPILTLIGRSFVGRMAASVLQSSNLTELITHTPQQYVTKGIELANDPEKLAKLKKILLSNRPGNPLFDTLNFTRSIERAFEIMYDRNCAGLPPDHIHLRS